MHGAGPAVHNEDVRGPARLAGATNNLDVHSRLILYKLHLDIFRFLPPGRAIAESPTRARRTNPLVRRKPPSGSCIDVLAKGWQQRVRTEDMRRQHDLRHRVAHGQLEYKIEQQRVELEHLPRSWP